MLNSPVLYLNVIMGIGIMTVSVYAWFKYHQFFCGNPMFDISYKQQWETGTYKRNKKACVSALDTTHDTQAQL